MAEIQWRPEQREAIVSDGQSLLVSAAAGSGKTSVLAERCVHLVCDATPRREVDELLVVTFTESAAAEMRQRIERRLRQRLEAHPEPWLQRQVALLPQAPIGTLHGFCFRLLRQNFHLLGLDPATTALDEADGALLRGEIARQVLGDWHEGAGAADGDQRQAVERIGRFQRLIDCYCGNSADEDLVGQIIGLHAMMDSLVDPGHWRQQAIERIAEAAERPLHQSHLGRAHLAELHRELVRVSSDCAELREWIANFSSRHAEYLEAIEAGLARIAVALEDGGLDAAVQQNAAWGDLDRRPAVKKDFPRYELTKSRFEDLKKRLDALREQFELNEAHWRGGMEQVLPHARTLLELVEDFSARYAAAKRRQRVVDFADMEQMALRLLREGAGPGLTPSAVALSCQARFSHVLVDEYQDINEVQNAILRLVSRECRSTGGNLFCVGDVKQSIYRFRLADPSQFLQRRQQFLGDAAAGRVIDLQANFRSRGKLLAAINGIFERLMSAEAAEIEYDATQALVCGAEYPESEQVPHFSGAPIELHLLVEDQEAEESEESEAEQDLDRTEKEARLAAELIAGWFSAAEGAKHVYDAKAQCWRPIQYSDIVVLLRATAVRAGQYADQLRQRGIPVFTDKGSDYFKAVEVQDVLAVLDVLDNQQQDIPLAAVLRSPLSGLREPEESMARIRLAFPPPLPFCLAVVRYAQERSDELAQQLQRLLAQLDAWRQMARHRPLADVLWTIYDQTGYLAFCAGLPDGAQRQANLIELHERARQFGSFQRQGLYRFLQFMKSLQEQTQVPQPSIAAPQNAVRIMSIHGSKGLEFPVVLVADLGKKIRLDCDGKILADRSALLGLRCVDDQRRIHYATLAWQQVSRRVRQQQLAEELRVLYVAMTRAKEHLVLLGCCKRKQQQKWELAGANLGGVMEAGAVQAANCMLDWIAPVAYALQKSGQFRVLPQAAPASAQPVAQEETSPVPQHLAELRPLESPPPLDETARQIIARLEYRYPHQAMTGRDASLSITAWTKHQHQQEWETARHPVPRSSEFMLPPPQFALNETSPSGADRGTATHLVLQYLDLSRPCDAADLEEQIAGMCQRRHLTEAQAKLVQRDDILWFMASVTGQLLRAAADSVWRELPFYFAVGETADTGLDRTMIRGRIDALVPWEKDGWLVVDYKTDRVSGEQVEQRAAQYQEQVRQYRYAVEQITPGRPVRQVRLIFLNARREWVVQ